MKATRHYYDGLAVIAEYECGPATGQPRRGTGCPPNCGTGFQPVLAREFLWASSGVSEPGAQATGPSFPHPLAMVDFTAAGDLGAGIPETLYYVHDALGSVAGLLNDPNSLEPNSPGGGTGVPARLVERYDYDPYGTTYISCRDSNAPDPNAPAAFVPCETSRYGNPFVCLLSRIRG